jgi:hypothetical protein
VALHYSGKSRPKALLENSSIMISARKGLPVSLGEDEPNSEHLPPRDTRGLAPSPWGKRMRAHTFHAMTVASPGLVHTVVGRGVTPASDVSAKTKDVTNLGRARGVDRGGRVCSVKQGSKTPSLGAGCK